LTLQNSTLSNNSASNDGGGILDGGFLTITNSTISTNNAGRDGGGIMVYSGTVNLQSSTIANNYVYEGLFDPATTGSGGVDVYSGASVTFHQSVIAGNYYSPLFGSPSSDDCFGTLTSQHYNWISAIPVTCIVSGFNVTDHTGNPQLGPLRDNGGPTWTHVPGQGSGLIDSGDPACALATDQRGVYRPIDGNRNGIALCDIGAVEFQLPLYLPVVTR
jgi:hypothetical protein